MAAAFNHRLRKVTESAESVNSEYMEQEPTMDVWRKAPSGIQGQSEVKSQM